MIEIHNHNNPRHPTRLLCRDILALRRANQARDAAAEQTLAAGEDFAHISDTSGNPRESLNTEHLRRVRIARDIWEARNCKARFIGRILESGQRQESSRKEC